MVNTINHGVDLKVHFCHKFFQFHHPTCLGKKKLKKFDCLIGKSLHLGREGLGQRNLSRQSPVEFMHFSPSGSGAIGSFLRAAADSFFGF